MSVNQQNLKGSLNAVNGQTVLDQNGKVDQNGKLQAENKNTKDKPYNFEDCVTFVSTGNLVKLKEALKKRKY